MFNRFETSFDCCNLKIKQNTVEKSIKSTGWCCFVLDAVKTATLNVNWLF